MIINGLKIVMPGLAAAVVLAAGCEQDYPYLRTPEALATMDKVCGVYEMVSLEWTGGPVDLNGDGTAMPGLLEEALSGEFLGYTVDNLDRGTGRITGVVYAPAYDPEKTGYNGSSGKYAGTEIMLPLFMGDYEEGTRWPYSLGAIHAYYCVEPSGELTLAYDREQKNSFHQDSTTLPECAFSAIRVVWEENGDFRISAETAFYDYLSKRMVGGRETALYHCISTKVRETR